jgi:hypothetical protein
MPIAILGWGSLIWDPRDLPRESPWSRGGPELKIEFSRISRDARLTLVIDPVAGAPVVTRYALSPRTLIADAVEDLARREGTVRKWIGYVDLERDESSPRGTSQDAEVTQILKRWCREKKFNGAVWTALSPNFLEETGRAFTTENALAYLSGLPKGARAVALHYIDSAPDEVATPVRTARRAAFA